ncbi:MAG: single-stranded DNA-binding protein [Clostridia bacterium]|nr:single-stranded DNA-binding protein [Clostridia bacterium]
MINNIVLVGRIANDIEVKELEKSKVVQVNLAVQRRYKNANGEYETDFISCQVWNELATTLKEYCKKGDLVGITGRLTTSVYEVEGNKRKSYDVVVENITFLQAKKTEE